MITSRPCLILFFVVTTTVLLPQPFTRISILLDRIGRCGKTYLSFTISPEIHPQSYGVIDGWVCRLVNKCRCQSGHRKDDQSRLNTPMNGGSSKESQWPLPGKHEYPKDEVDDL